MLSRAAGKRREIAVRTALGASRVRIVRQLLTESVVLSLAGGGLGLLLGIIGIRALLSINTAGLPRLVQDGSLVGLDWRVLGFTAALAGLACILFGLAPAWRATSVTPGVVLKKSGRGTTGGRSGFGFRRILVVSQIALSLMLLVGALLFARSLNNLAMVDAGFRQDGILVTDIDFSALGLSNERRLAFSSELLSRVRAIPGVDSAAIAEIVPLTGKITMY